MCGGSSVGEVPEDGPRKPTFGDPCNGCGLCCVATACGMALTVISTARKGQSCPALEWEGGRSWCGLVRHPTRYIDKPVHVLAEVARLGGPADFLDEHLGSICAEDLGGVGGRCDAGPLGGMGIDHDAGRTALEWVRGGRIVHV